MNIDGLIVEIKQHEGFEGSTYNDHLGNPTIGYGTLLPLTPLEATLILKIRLTAKIEELKIKKPLFKKLPEEVQMILANMAYQMGVRGLLMFTKTWKYLEGWEFEKAGEEMLDSLWAIQTPLRAVELSKRMKRVQG